MRRQPGAWNPPLFPTSLCPPGAVDAAGSEGRARARYAVGRTMFETDRIPAEWVRRCNRMDELWLPTAFHRRVFAASGVHSSKLHVVPEPVDVDRFNPRRVRAAPLPLGRRVVPLTVADAEDGGSRGRYAAAARTTALPTFRSPPPPVPAQRHGRNWCIARPPSVPQAAPAALRPHLTQTGAPSVARGGNRSTVFLSIFKWEARKAWDVLLTAYFDEFSADEPVELYIKTSPFHSDANFDRQIRELLRGREDASERHGADRGRLMRRLPPVYLIDDHLSLEQLAALYKAADAFVLPSRGEGWGRPQVEAMAMELPVIATNWSGPTAYLTDANGYPLAIRGLVPIETGPFRGHRWADPSPAHLRQLMRRVHDSPTEARLKGRRARRDMIERFSPGVVAQLVAGQLHRIAVALRTRGNVSRAPPFSPISSPNPSTD